MAVVDITTKVVLFRLHRSIATFLTDSRQQLPPNVDMTEKINAVLQELIFRDTIVVHRFLTNL